jgi:hypothetical protein
VTTEESRAYEHTKHWLESNENIEELQRTLARASTTIERLREARRVRPETLRQRVTI